MRRTYKRTPKTRKSIRKLRGRLHHGGDSLGRIGPSNKINVRVCEDTRDPETGHFTDVEIAVLPPSMSERRGIGLGVGADPAFVIAQRITAALDPVRAPGRVKTLADMSAAERAQLGAPLSTAARTPRSVAPPAAETVTNLRLGPVFDYVVRPHGPRTYRMPRRLLFCVNDDWRALQDVAHRLHIRREKFMDAYSLSEEKWRQVLAWGVREANRIEQTIVLRHG